MLPQYLVTDSLVHRNLGRWSYRNILTWRYISSTTAPSPPPAPTSLTRTPDTLTSKSTSEPTSPRPNSLLIDTQIQRQKDRWRGGQNLSERWRRLERSLRGKEAYGAHRDVLVDQAQDAEEGTEQGRAADSSDAGAKKMGKGSRVFHGFVVPEKPKEPQSDGTSCALTLRRIVVLTQGHFCRMLYVWLRDLRVRSL